MKTQTGISFSTRTFAGARSAGGLLKWLDHRIGSVLWILPLLFALTACSSGKPSPWQGPNEPVNVHLTPWFFDGTPGKHIQTARYNIYSTIEDEDFLYGIAQLMEGAYDQYHSITPTLPVTGRPMDCFIFSQRTEWAEYTEKNTGPDAEVYLQINRGGYAYKEIFATYFLGDVGTYTVSAHEGWHQYVARHYKGRLPPFLEEGFACMFENLVHDGRLPRWNLNANPYRARGLKTAIDNRNLWSLDTLITMHAGQIVDEPAPRIEAFYAQSWAFVRFMMDAEGGKYRPAMDKLLADTVAGTVYNPFSNTLPLPGRDPWRPQLMPSIMEHYFQMPLSDIDKAYQAYICTLADTVPHHDGYP